MTICEGSVVLVRFPFSDLESSKKRPALVVKRVRLNSRESIITIAMISSRVTGIRLEGDILLKHWEECQLLRPSLVRLAKMATIDNALIEKIMGELSDYDISQIKSEFKKLFGFWLKKSSLRRPQRRR